ncbi:uncharacterized protein SCHCODRAFT_02630420 [Schizophyllum commune H4-8]|nr:uncharacterized protein SCHCODRAFT_02630420 [Schizophyllum commune H4-8]KAI5889932.1 hypothetical protein SCHCODRAFT_02630420 [Schizophyllum commune H4-8]
MPKREKTPDTEPDSKFLAIYQTYPANADMELEDDQIRLARWIASIIPSDYLVAIHYKPKARGMTLIEILNECRDIGKLLLGEHRWSEMLREPTEDEKERTSRIYYSIYSTTREAQKDGWKQISVLSRWFDERCFRPDEICTQPYPTPYYCGLPPEDKTNKPICRPLPVAEKPRPVQPAPRIVPGSIQYIEQSNAPTSKNARRKKKKGAASQKSLPVGASSTWDKPIVENRPKAEQIRNQLWSVGAGPKASNIIATDPDDLVDRMHGITVSDSAAHATQALLQGDDDDDDQEPGYTFHGSSSMPDDAASPDQDASGWQAVGETQIKRVVKNSCPEHAHCSPGVCEVAKQYKREMQRKQEEAERAAARKERGRRPRGEDGGHRSAFSSNATSPVRHYGSSGDTEGSDNGGEGSSAVDDLWRQPKGLAKPAQNNRGGRGRAPGRGRGQGRSNGVKGGAGGGDGAAHGSAWADPGSKKDWAAQGHKPRRH